MNIKTIDPQIAADLFADGSAEPGNTAQGWILGGSQHVRTARWEEIYWLVVRKLDTDEWYGVEYREGLTENQETEYPWDQDDAEPLPLTPLVAREVATTVYEEAK